MTSAVRLGPAGASPPGQGSNSSADEGDDRFPGAEPARFHSAGFATVIEQLRASPHLNEGRINIVALDAIADRLGERWVSRQSLVYEHAEKVLRRELGENAAIHRISETEYLLIQPDVSRLASRLRSLDSLRQILHHFLGAAAAADLKLHSVTRITDDEVFGQRVDIDALNAGQTASTARIYEDSSPARAHDRWAPFVTSTGRRVGVACSLEPVIRLNSDGRLGFRVARQVVRLADGALLAQRDLETLSQRECEELDFAMMARGIERLRANGPHCRPPVLIIPISHTTVQSRCGQAKVAELLRQGRDSVGHGLICELIGLNGASSAALLDTIAALRPFCLHVIGHLDGCLGQDLRALRDARLNGVSVQCPPLTAGAEFIEWTRRFVIQGRRVAKVLFLDQVPSLAHARLAAPLGVTHVTLAEQSPTKPGGSESTISAAAGTVRPNAP